MKYRWLLGMLVSLTACSVDDDKDFAHGASGSGGGAGQAPSPTGGTPSTPKGGTSGGPSTTGGSQNAGGGGSPTATGGSTQGGGTTGGGGAGPSGGTPGNGGTPNAGGGGTTGGGSDGGGASGAPAGGSGGGTPPIGASNDVLERNGNPQRTGHFVQPALTKEAAAKMTFEDGFKATFDGNMYASPLYMKSGPGGKGAFFAVSANNVVAALDETTGATLWSKSLGASPGKAGQACGFGSDPVGILSTPVIDAESGTIFVAAALGSGGVERHEVHALSIEDGSSRPGWPVNVNTLKSGSISFNAPFQNQRSALSLVNGTVYVGYGGFVGDCGDYRGWVVAIDADDPASTGAWATRGAKGDAIWAAGGFASDGTAIFPVTGNNMNSAAGRDATDSEAVLRITGLAELERNNQNQYWPTIWKSMDQADADFGGTNSMIFKVPGSTPETLLVAIAKDGHFYLLDPSNLGGEGGHVVDFRVATGAMAIKTVPTAYTTAEGTYVAFTTDSGAECPNNVGGRALMSVKITPGAPPTADTAWCAPGGNPSTAPISTSTDGSNNTIVWYINGGQLRGVDGDTGETVFDGGGMCNGVQRWTSPIAVNGRIVTGANGRLCSWKAP